MGASARDYVKRDFADIYFCRRAVLLTSPIGRRLHLRGRVARPLLYDLLADEWKVALMTTSDLTKFLQSSGYDHETEGNDGEVSVPSSELLFFNLEVLRDILA